MTIQRLYICELGSQAYQTTWQAMRDYTQQRNGNSEDQLWLVEHPAVFTQGQAGKAEHILCTDKIPVIQSDRGGQVTYHGPGQIVCYFLLDLKRKGLTIKRLVTAAEQAVISLLSHYGLTGERKATAPGVYLQGKKVCSLGFRIKRHCSYHGLALNVDMDLKPFSQINPCGYKNLAVTQLSDWLTTVELATTKDLLVEYLSQALGYNQLIYTIDNQTLLRP